MSEACRLIRWDKMGDPTQRAGRRGDWFALGWRPPIVQPGFAGSIRIGTGISTTDSKLVYYGYQAAFAPFFGKLIYSPETIVYLIAQQNTALDVKQGLLRCAAGASSFGTQGAEVEIEGDEKRVFYWVPGSQVYNIGDGAGGRPFTDFMKSNFGRVLSFNVRDALIPAPGFNSCIRVGNLSSSYGFLTGSYGENAGTQLINGLLSTSANAIHLRALGAAQTWGATALLECSDGVTYTMPWNGANSQYELAAGDGSPGTGLALKNYFVSKLGGVVSYNVTAAP